MAKKNVGFIELEWTCPNCNTRNKGTVKTCTGCGSAQPENVEFHEPVLEELVIDPKKIEQAKAGPDIHCAFCGARNPSSTTVCTNCGADLSQGKLRQTGRVVGAFKQDHETEIICPSCGESNPSSGLTCTKCGSALHPAAPSTFTTPPTSVPSPASNRKFPIWIPILAVAGIGIILFLVLLFQQKDAQAGVAQRLWERTLEIEQFGPVEHSDWRSELPAAAANVSCAQKQRSTSNEPVAGAREVCGTPYTVDNGTGFGEVVTDCVYEVYEDYCQYKIDEWSTYTEVTSTGQNDEPTWPTTQLTANQRPGDQAEHYQIIFEVNGGQKTFTTSDEEIYKKAVVGSQWNLTLNGLGQIIDLQPVE